MSAINFPLHVTRGSRAIWIKDADSHTVLAIFKSSDENEELETCERLVRLINSASDLLAALKLCERYIGGPRCPAYLQEPLRAARAAISKAEGGPDVRR